MGNFFVSPANMAAQSNRGRSEASFRRIFGLPESSHRRACLLSMLENEVIFGNNYFAIYHSYSFSSLLYEVHSCLVSCALDIANVPPLPRLFRCPFLSCTLDSIKECIEKKHKNDHDCQVRAVAIAGVSSLYDYDECSIIDHFNTGYSCTDVDFVNLLSSALATLGLDQEQQSLLETKIMNIAKKYSFPKWISPSWDWTGGVDGRGRGNVLQLFVRKDMIHTMAYAARPMGFFDPTRHLSDDQASPVAGQLRLLVDPCAFLDGRIKAYHFAANRNLDRTNLQKDLHDIIAPFLITKQQKMKFLAEVDPNGELVKFATIDLLANESVKETLEKKRTHSMKKDLGKRMITRSMSKRLTRRHQERKKLSKHTKTTRTMRKR